VNQNISLVDIPLLISTNARKMEKRRLVYRNFVAECDPTKNAIISLKNNLSGKELYVYLSSLNDIIFRSSVLFDIMNKAEENGEDAELYREDIHHYGEKKGIPKKIVGIVKRYQNKLSVCIQQMWDENGDGDWKYSTSLIKLTPEDDLEKLRSFAQEMHREFEATYKPKVPYKTNNANIPPVKNSQA